MLGAHILDGDTVVVRAQAQAQAETGEDVAAMLDGEATVKRLRRDCTHVWLTVENPRENPLIDHDLIRVLGVRSIVTAAELPAWDGRSRHVPACGCSVNWKCPSD
ncbi:LexA family protein [Streptomyces sp. cg28]|uniref:LexA family protein n=1 Tax=Streptomyces sp. cg28 TaxID=3403457 RepID=UPI003B214C3E